MDEQHQLAERLAKARIEAGMSTRQVARQLGIRHASITENEKGRRTVPALEAVKLARIYGVSVSVLLEDVPSLDGQAQDMLHGPDVRPLQ